EFLEQNACLGASLGLFGASFLSSALAGAETLSLENEVIAGVWSTSGGILRAREIADRRSHARLTVPDHTFAIILADGVRLDSTQMRIVGTPTTEAVTALPQSSRLAGRFPGRRLTVVLEDE